MAAMVRAVLFDLFETLVTESGTQPTRASRLGGALGLDSEAFRIQWKTRRPRVVLGELSFGEALAEISCLLTGSVNSAAVRRVCAQRIREKALAFAKIDPYVSALIGRLRTRGVSLAVISNCFAEDVAAWPAWPLARDFQCSVFSYVAGMAKPDPAIYLTATRALDVEPEDAMFIGDGGDDELVGAGRAGLRVCRADWFSTRSHHMTDAGKPLRSCS
jgi:HAD superfamily hydrolase (TIGR01509 family)